MSQNSTIQPIALSPNQASLRIGISVRAIYARIALGEIKSFKVGKRRLISDRELIRFLEKKIQEAA
jgi:excisionase family DNA binding protein